MTILIFRQKARRIQPEVGLHSPFAMTSADRKHHCTHTSLAGSGGRTGRENTLAGSSLHTQRLRRAADATHQGGCGLLQEAYRSLRQMAQPVERKRCTLLFCEFHKSRTAHFASPVHNPPGTRCQATVRRTTRPLPLRTAHRRPTHLPGLSHPRQCPAPAGQHRFLE